MSARPAYEPVVRRLWSMVYAAIVYRPSSVVPCAPRVA